MNTPIYPDHLNPTTENIAVRSFSQLLEMLIIAKDRDCQRELHMIFGRLHDMIHICSLKSLLNFEDDISRVATNTDMSFAVLWLLPLRGIIRKKQKIAERKAKAIRTVELRREDTRDNFEQTNIYNC